MTKEQYQKIDDQLTARVIIWQGRKRASDLSLEDKIDADRTYRELSIALDMLHKYYYQLVDDV